MTVPFLNYPVNNRNPGTYFEVNASLANTGQRNRRALIVAPSIVPGPAVPTLCTSNAQAQVLAGTGSAGARMFYNYVKQDSFGETWLLPVQDNPAGTQGTQVTTYAGLATETGTWTQNICGTTVQALVTVGMTPTALAAALSAALNAIPTAFMTATASANTLTCTARNRGPLDITGVVGPPPGDAPLPAGLTVFTQVTNLGSGPPDYTLALANCGEQPFDIIVAPTTDTATLDSFRDFLSDSIGRWNPLHQLFGMGFAAMNASLGVATAALTARNDQHMMILPVFGSETPAWQIAALCAGSVATSLRNDPGVPLRGIALGFKSPRIEQRYSFKERNILLYDGGSTFTVGNDNVPRVSRLVTTYQQNASGVPDDSYLDIGTLFQLQDEIEFYQADLSTVYQNKKLVLDGTRFGAGSIDVTTAQIIGLHVVALYREREEAGRVVDSPGFKKAMRSENAGGGRVFIYAPIRLASGLQIIATLVAFTKP